MGSEGNITNPDRIAKVRILLVGNTGCGKTSLTHLLALGRPAHSVQQTVGCNTFVKEVDSAVPDRGSYGDQQSAQHFVELWDIGAHDRYKDLRHLFYASINGVLLVHDASMSPVRARGNVEMWAREVAKLASFSAPFAPEVASAQPGGLPVPCLIVANKTDLTRSMLGLLCGTGGAGQSEGLWAVHRWQQLWESWFARIWPSRENAFRTPETSPLRSPSGFAESAHGPPPPTTATSAKLGDYDPHAFHQFFLQCIRSRYAPSDQSFEGPNFNANFMRKDGVPDNSGPASAWWGGSNTRSSAAQPSLTHQQSHAPWQDAASHAAQRDTEHRPFAVQTTGLMGQSHVLSEKEDRERASLFGGRVRNSSRPVGGLAVPGISHSGVPGSNLGSSAFGGFQHDRIDD